MLSMASSFPRTANSRIYVNAIVILITLLILFLVLASSKGGHVLSLVTRYMDSGDNYIFPELFRGPEMTRDIWPVFIASLERFLTASPWHFFRLSFKGATLCGQLVSATTVAMVSKATSLFAIVSTVYLGTLGAILGATALLGTTNLLSRAKSGLKLLSNVPRPATIGCYLSDHAQLVRKSRPMIDISPKSESTCNLSQANHPPRPDSVQRFCEFAQDETTVALDDRCAKAAYAYFVIDLMIIATVIPVKHFTSYPSLTVCAAFGVIGYWLRSTCKLRVQLGRSESRFHRYRLLANQAYANLARQARTVIRQLCTIECVQSRFKAESEKLDTEREWNVQLVRQLDTVAVEGLDKSKENGDRFLDMQKTYQASITALRKSIADQEKEFELMQVQYCSELHRLQEESSRAMAEQVHQLKATASKQCTLIENVQSHDLRASFETLSRLLEVERVNSSALRLQVDVSKRQLRMFRLVTESVLEAERTNLQAQNDEIEALKLACEAEREEVEVLRRQVKALRVLCEVRMEDVEALRTVSEMYRLEGKTARTGCIADESTTREPVSTLGDSISATLSRLLMERDCARAELARKKAQVAELALTLDRYKDTCLLKDAQVASLQKTVRNDRALHNRDCAQLIGEQCEREFKLKTLAKAKKAAEEAVRSMTEAKARAELEQERLLACYDVEEDDVVDLQQYRQRSAALFYSDEAENDVPTVRINIKICGGAARSRGSKEITRNRMKFIERCKSWVDPVSVVVPDHLVEDGVLRVHLPTFDEVKVQRASEMVMNPGYDYGLVNSLPMSMIALDSGDHPVHTQAESDGVSVTATSPVVRVRVNRSTNLNYTRADSDAFRVLQVHQISTCSDLSNGRATVNAFTPVSMVCYYDLFDHAADNWACPAVRIGRSDRQVADLNPILRSEKPTPCGFGDVRGKRERIPFAQIKPGYCNLFNSFAWGDGGLGAKGKTFAHPKPSAYPNDGVDLESKTHKQIIPLANGSQSYSTVGVPFKSEIARRDLVISDIEAAEDTPSVNQSYFLTSGASVLDGSLFEDVCTVQCGLEDGWLKKHKTTSWSDTLSDLHDNELVR